MGVNVLVKKIFVGLVIFLFYLPVVLADGSVHRKTIKMITWWGYYHSPEVTNYLENKCNVKLSIDEYYSNDEFLRRWEGMTDYYDIINLSDIVYPVIKNKIPSVKNSSIWKNSFHYHPAIKKHYDEQNYPHNVAYFDHLVTGFLWNTSNINISPQDSVGSIFKKANKKYVILIDDPVEIMKLIETSLNFKMTDNSISLSNFRKMTQGNNIYIVNNNNLALKNPNFAFSYRWAGPTVSSLIESDPSKYKFLVHPKLSYISTALLIQTSNQPEAHCIAKSLTAKSFSVLMQKEGIFLSPFANYKNIANPLVKNIYKQFITSLSTPSWLDNSYKNNFRELNRSWQMTKLALNSPLKIYEIED